MLSLVILIFFISGASGLIYEIVWTRMLTLVFGNTSYSVSTVLASFMGGLALGSWLIGRFVDRIKNLLRLYGILELLIGMFALLIPYLLSLLNPFYREIWHSMKLSMPALNAVKFVLSFLVFLVPTILMGATLPVFSRVFVTSRAELGKKMGLLYSINTFGAVFGSFLTGFILIAIFGIYKTTVLAASLNILIGALALFLGLGYKQKAPSKKKEKTGVVFPKKIAVLCAAVFGVSGFISLGYEVIWTRNLAFIFTSSIYSFTVMLMVFLAGIASGSLVFSRIIDKEKNSPVVLSLIQICIGLFSVLALFSFRLFYYVFENNIFRNVSAMSLGDFALTGLYFVAVIFPSTFFMGAAFPVVARICVTDLKGLGRTIGNVYFLNTIGAILGSVITGFFLVPILGGQRTLCLLAAFNILLALLLLSFIAPSKKLPKKALLSLAAVAGLVAVFAFFSENVFLKTSTENFRRVSGQDVTPVLFKEGAEAMVTVYEVPGGRNRSLWINSLPVTGDCLETRLMAHLPLALSKKPENALVICFGMGASFKAALSKGINVDVVEIVEPVVKSYGFFDSDAVKVLSNPRGKVIINDGRNHVYLTDKKYDVITMDPSPPIYSAGTVNLYTAEFFKECRRILTDNGAICLWVPACKKAEFDLILNAFSQSFSTTLWESFEVAGVFVVGTKEKLSINREEFLKYFKDPAVIENVKKYPDFRAEQLFGKFILNNDKVKEYLQGVPVMTDDKPYVEYPLLRWRDSDIKDRTKYFTEKRSNIQLLMK